MTGTFPKFLATISLVCILSACAAPAMPVGTAASPSATNTPIPSATRPAPTALPVPSATPAAPALLLPQYTLDASLDYEAKTLSVKQDIDYPNTSGGPIADMLLAVESNLIPGVFSLSALSQDNQPVNNYSMTGQRLAWKLPAPLPAGAKTHLHLEYQLNLPQAQQGNPNVVRPQIFGVTARQVNLTDWYPMVLPFEAGSGWRLADPWFYGEHLVYPLANFDVTLRFKDAANAPAVAASAAAQPVEGGARYVLERGRDFALSMGRQMQVKSAQVDGVTVTSYYYSGSEAAGQAVLDATSLALKTYGALFGPYPHKTLAAVQGDFNDGMEFDGLYYLSNSFYNLYDGTPNNYLPMVAAHETSHQWWWGRVASDQARNPWLDEALASYSEKIFYEKNYPDSVKWWWSVRIDFYQPSGKIDGDVPSYAGFAPYTNTVYKQGAHFFEDLRQALGDQAFFAFLKDYATQMDGKIAAPADFFRILKLHSTADLSALLTKYFSHPPQP